MTKKPERDVRYFLDLNLLTREIINWGIGDRWELAGEQILDPPFHRIFLTKGQYNKLDARHVEINQHAQE